MTRRLRLLSCLTLLIMSGCTDCKAITTYDSVVITFADGAATAPVSICIDHKCYEGDGTSFMPGFPLLSGNQLSLKMVDKLPSKRRQKSVDHSSVRRLEVFGTRVETVPGYIFFFCVHTG